jgi:malate dehydrogenase (oxaloacetate-decarboxylating)(NADP+)
MIRREEALEYHAGDRPGKVEIHPHKACYGPREMRLVYLPGAVFPAEEIARDPAAATRFTARGNLVAVITNGTAVPGLGDVGPLAAKPIQEGVGVLFKRLADIDVFDLELDERDPARFVDAVRMLEPTFGGINIKDLRAPEGLEIYDRLSQVARIPIFHENLYSTAVVATAALLNALDLTDKKMDEIQVVICGAGTVGLGCARLLTALGLPHEHLLLYDIDGLIHPDRPDINSYQAVFARSDHRRSLAAGLKGADVFLGASTGGVLTPEMIRPMNRFPIVFSMAMPDPEIGYAEAKAIRRDIIVATSRGQDPNAIVDLLSFPYIFRGALDVQARKISESMMLAAARALADLAREEVVEEVSRAYGYEAFTFGPEYLLPKPIDPRILVRESAAVARAAIEEGLAQVSVEREVYEENLTVRLGTGRDVLRHLIVKARQINPRIIFPDGTSETILRACAILVDEEIASPIVLGNEGAVRDTAGRLGLDLGGVSVIDPVHSPSYQGYAEAYFHLRGRRGVTRDLSVRRMADPLYFASLMLHTGDADMMICGMGSHYAEPLRTVIEVIGPAPGVRRISSCSIVLRPKEVFFLADCAVNIDPDAEQLAEIALLTSQLAGSLGIEPRIAMLSFSNFGAVDHPHTRKVRQATVLARAQNPGMVIEGEIQLATALDDDLRRRQFPFSELAQSANVFICPDLEAGHIALNVLQKLGSGVAVGPVLLGTRRPVHVIQYGSSVDEVVHLAAVGAVRSAVSELGGEGRGSEPIGVEDTGWM